MFRSSQASKYEGAFCKIMACYAVTAMLALCLRAYFVYANNRQRDSTSASSPLAGEESSVQSSFDGAVTPVKSLVYDSDKALSLLSRGALPQVKSIASVDKTDWEDSSFRYRLKRRGGKEDSRQRVWCIAVAICKWY